MASETVQIFVVDQQTPTPAPIENVLVRIFNAAGDTFITQNYTDALGVADFTLDGNDPPNEYQIRLSKTGIAFDGSLGDDSKSPQLIEIYSPAASSPSGTNDFTVKGETFIRPVATDPYLCRASGFFRSSDGQPYPNLDVIFTPRFKPAIVDGNSVMWGPINTRTDENGYLEIDLFRSGEYSVLLESLEDCPRLIVVPDASSINIVDLLFPVVAQVTFNPSSLAIIVGEEADVIPTVTASDQQVLEGTALADVEYTISDNSVATLSIQNDKLVITGASAGTAQVDVARLDESIVIIPDPGIVYTPLSIVVS
ncbi:MAG: Ig-like domain-containing protein [Candidatus Thorarchaeota archaeon]